MLLPSQVSAIVYINRIPIPEANAKRIWRKLNQAAVFDFEIPRKTIRRDLGGSLRQGTLVELRYGLGLEGQRIFYGYLPSTVSDTDLTEEAAMMHLSANDFIGQLKDQYITLGSSDSSFLDPVGSEIGGFVASLIQTAISAQNATIELTTRGIQGTNPAQFVTEDNAIRGTKTIKDFVDGYTALGYDDTNYPDVPFTYGYAQRDNDIFWMKQKSLSSPPAARFSLGQDAILSGTVKTSPVYSDAIVNAAVSTSQYSHSDRDTSRRWGSRRFVLSASTKSSYIADAQAFAVRLVESQKNERKSIVLDAARDAILLHPGDVIALYGAESSGLRSEAHRVAEVDITLTPAPKARIILDEPLKRLTDYIA